MSTITMKGTTGCTVCGLDVNAVNHNPTAIHLYDHPFQMALSPDTPKQPAPDELTHLRKLEQRVQLIQRQLQRKLYNYAGEEVVELKRALNDRIVELLEAEQAKERGR